MATPTICVIDDDMHVRDSLIFVLKDKGFEVGEASDGDRGLSLIGERNPDFVLIDLNMPGPHGLSVIPEIRKQRPDVAIVAMSGGAADGAQKALHAGADIWLQKPFRPRALLEALSAAALAHGRVWSASDDNLD